MRKIVFDVEIKSHGTLKIMVTININLILKFLIQCHNELIWNSCFVSFLITREVSINFNIYFKGRWYPTCYCLRLDLWVACTQLPNNIFLSIIVQSTLVSFIVHKWASIWGAEKITKPMHAKFNQFCSKISCRIDRLSSLDTCRLCSNIKRT